MTEFIGFLSNEGKVQSQMWADVPFEVRDRVEWRGMRKARCVLYTEKQPFSRSAGWNVIVTSGGTDSDKNPWRKAHTTNYNVWVIYDKRRTDLALKRYFLLQEAANHTNMLSAGCWF